MNDSRTANQVSLVLVGRYHFRATQSLSHAIGDVSRFNPAVPTRPLYLLCIQRLNAQRSGTDCVCRRERKPACSENTAISHAHPPASLCVRVEVYISFAAEPPWPIIRRSVKDGHQEKKLDYISQDISRRSAGCGVHSCQTER